MNEIADLGREIKGLAKFCSVNSTFPNGFSPFDIFAFPLHPTVRLGWLLSQGFFSHDPVPTIFHLKATA